MQILSRALAAARAAQARGMLRILDPSPADRVGAELLAEVDVATPNADEAEALTGVEVRDEDSAAQAAEELVRRGTSMAAVKLPEGGCVLSMPQGRFCAATGDGAGDVIDTTGAGDAFAAALAAALLTGCEPAEAARHAAAASRFAVTRWGAQAGLTRREDLDRALEAITLRPL